MEPPDIVDIDILKAFHQHQITDKSFGPALGPAAIVRMQSILQDYHFNTVCAASPWTMDHHDRDLIEQLAFGTARAVREIDTIPKHIVENWLRNRRQAKSCEIGHMDLFAYKL